MKLNISKEQYESIYSNLLVPDYSLFTDDVTSQNNLWTKFMTSKLWRLNNLYTITDKEGNLIRFNMNWGQHKVYASSLIHSRIIVLKSRQQRH